MKLEKVKKIIKDIENIEKTISYIEEENEILKLNIRDAEDDKSKLIENENKIMEFLRQKEIEISKLTLNI